MVEKTGNINALTCRRETFEVDTGHKTTLDVINGSGQTVLDIVAKCLIEVPNSNTKLCLLNKLFFMGGLITSRELATRVNLENSYVFNRRVARTFSFYCAPAMDHNGIVTRLAPFANPATTDALNSDLAKCLSFDPSNPPKFTLAETTDESVLISAVDAQ